ncbi:MAG TPA: hypothetical protein VNG51_27615 [Ktedonobacteraceae bacterium]|nr:hypothetical protein [Ktedonobacteraceae bacterium]
MSESRPQQKEIKAGITNLATSLLDETVSLRMAWVISGISVIGGVTDDPRHAQ